MKKVITGFICGAIFFSGVAYAASSLTAKVEDHKVYIDGKEKVLRDKPVVIDGKTYLPAREMAESLGYDVVLDKKDIKLYSKTKDGKNPNSSDGSTQKVNFQKLPITQKINDVEVSVHAVRMTEEKTDFEITIKNNTDDETITPELVRTIVGANYQIEGKTYEKAGISQDNPDFEDGAIKPQKEKHGWLSNKALTNKDVRNLTLSLSLKGKGETRVYTFYIDCKDLKFRTL